MRDKRPVDELSIEELERVLAIKRREERQTQLERMRRSGRVIDSVEVPPVPMPTSPPNGGVHDPVAAALAAMTRVEPPTRVEVPARVESSPRGEDASTSNAPKAKTSRPTPAPRITFADGAGVPHFDDAGAIGFEDDAALPAPRPANPRATRRWMDRLLLLVEVAAVVLIGFIAVNLLSAITTLERETAEAQQVADEQRRLTIPTLAPTPTLRLDQVVLPGGHIYVAGSEPQFNFNEVPTHLHARVNSEWVQPVISRPPRTSETALSLIVPKLELNGAIVQGVDVDALRQGVGQLPNGVQPSDETGNVVFAAHNDVYGQLFRYLDRLVAGDTFQIQTQSTVFTYRVTETRLVAPNDVYVIDDRQGATATLISCYPYQVNTQRIVVFADRIS